MTTRTRKQRRAKGAALLLALASAAPAPATAQDLTFAGVTVTSDYVVAGASQSGGRPALQAYLEHNLANGLYAGIWSSQVDFSEFGLTDTAEIDLYVGHRGQSGRFSWDAAYYRYYYDDSGFDSDELWLQGSVAVTETASVGLHLRHYFNGLFEDGWVYGPKASLGLSEATSLSGAYQYNTTLETGAWDLTLRHQLTATLSARATYYDSETTDPILGVALSFDTDLASLFN